jgi:hypothetical protein
MARSKDQAHRVLDLGLFFVPQPPLNLLEERDDLRSWGHSVFDFLEQALPDFRRRALCPRMVKHKHYSQNENGEHNGQN